MQLLKFSSLGGLEKEGWNVPWNLIQVLLFFHKGYVIMSCEDHLFDSNVFISSEQYNVNSAVYFNMESIQTKGDEICTKEDEY